MFIHTLESLEEFEDYIKQLEETVGLSTETYQEVTKAISEERDKLKNLSLSGVMCSCGKYEKCIRKVKVKDGGYFGSTKLYVDKKDHFRCGKVQKQIKQMKDMFNNYT